ncbi:MAG TPA: ABC transporter substrate-binding protein [Candidatus Binatia bacterium]|nr:ABC transporter substrate-binding protein [Candidatus Binatia bacterium]
MNTRRDGHWSRREFLTSVSLAGGAALLGLESDVAAAEPPPETTRIRLTSIPGVCVAPQYVSEELLRVEGFTDVQYVKLKLDGLYKAFASGDVDISMAYAPPFIIQIEAGEPILLLGGVHSGCYELFGSQQVRTIRDLKGKTVAIPGLGSPHHVFVASMAAYVGIDPRKDINWATHPVPESMRFLAEAKIDALMGFPPVSQELRAKKIGRVVVNSGADRPWSQYFCCVMASNREFVRKHPAATKRAMRAILKANQMCALEPERVGRLLVDKGFTPQYDYAVQAIKEIPYDKWRDYDAEDTVRFYSLRLQEAGMIKSSPQKIIAQGTDWRFLRELKKELKG